MKKYILLLLALLLATFLTACGENELDDTEIETEIITGVPNPFVTLTKEEFEEAYGASYVPERAVDVVYAHINLSDNENGINQIEFSLDGIEYSFRYLIGEEQDISGMYYTWTQNNDDENSIFSIKLSDQETGISSWYVDGVNYNISMITDATKDLLLDMSEQYFNFYCNK